MTLTEEKKNVELNLDNRPAQPGNNKPISDDVIIEIVHAFKDIIIEFINRRYQSSADK
jgi:hypothetical protein